MLRVWTPPGVSLDAAPPGGWPLLLMNDGQVGGLRGGTAMLHSAALRCAVLLQPGRKQGAQRSDRRVH